MPVYPQAVLPVQVHPEAVLPALVRLVAVVRVGVVPDKGGPARGARPEAAAVSAAHVEDKPKNIADHGQIARVTSIVAVDTARQAAAARAISRRASRCGSQDEIGFLHLHIGNGKTGKKKRQRMGCVCHRRLQQVNLRNPVVYPVEACSA